jgi:hypothetical protein
MPRQRKFRSRSKEGEKMGMGGEPRASPMVLGLPGGVKPGVADLTAVRGPASVRLTEFDRSPARARRNGIVAFGTYLPYYRLERKAIAETLGTPGAPGLRSVACYDEDATSMAPDPGRGGQASDQERGAGSDACPHAQPGRRSR